MDTFARSRWAFRQVRKGEKQHAAEEHRGGTQANLFGGAEASETLDTADVLQYDRYVVAFSGGKDSAAALLHLLDLGVPSDRVELWHHDVDGRSAEGTLPDQGLMDWPVTVSYCQKVADELGIPIYYSWRIGGFESEMLRENERTNPVCWETPEGTIDQAGGEQGTRSTRRRFPQVSAFLSVRWCSSSLKIDVCGMALRNQPRFRRGRTLFISGERAEESVARSRYASFEPYRDDLRGGKRYKRPIDHWRPVLYWKAGRVWNILRDWGMTPHPAYVLGWGRVSCMGCIFGSAHQFASVQEIAPDRFERIASYEEAFGCTIKRGENVRQLAARGNAYQMENGDVEAALSKTYDGTVFQKVSEWTLPNGAFGEACGPT